MRASGRLTSEPCSEKPSVHPTGLDGLPTVARRTSLPEGNVPALRLGQMPFCSGCPHLIRGGCTVVNGLRLLLVGASPSLALPTLERLRDLGCDAGLFVEPMANPGEAGIKGFHDALVVDQDVRWSVAEPIVREARHWRPWLPVVLIGEKFIHSAELQGWLSRGPLVRLAATVSDSDLREAFARFNCRDLRRHGGATASLAMASRMG